MTAVDDLDPRAVAVTAALHDWASLYPIPAWGLARGEQAEQLAANWARAAARMVMDALASVPPVPDPKLLRLLGELVDGDDCWFDHHGGCQAHGFLSLEPGEQCPNAEAKVLLAAAEGGAS